MVKKMADAAPPARDFVAALRKMEASWGMPGLIAEVKKASPRRARFFASPGAASAR